MSEHNGRHSNILLKSPHGTKPPHSAGKGLVMGNEPGKGVIPQVHDPIPTLKVKFGCLYVESVFYRYAIESGWTGRPAEDQARKLYSVYSEHGFGSLFDTVKNWAIAATNR